MRTVGGIGLALTFAGLAWMAVACPGAFKLFLALMMLPALIVLA